MVPRTGVEPVTCPLGGGRAIQLCHRGKPIGEYSFFTLADQSMPSMLGSILIFLQLGNTGMSMMHWDCLKFHELTAAQLYEILALRSAVFVVEQNCVYQDPDGYDPNALHLMGHRDNNLLCYTRLLAPGVKYEGASIGRVITNTAARGTGLGKQLMTESIKACENHWPGSPISISAQQYLEKFYFELGFKAETDPYMEDGIPHIKMIRDSKSG